MSLVVRGGAEAGSQMSFGMVDEYSSSWEVQKEEGGYHRYHSVRKTEKAYKYTIQSYQQTTAKVK